MLIGCVLRGCVDGYLRKRRVRYQHHHPYKFPKTQPHFDFLRMSSCHQNTITIAAAVADVGSARARASGGGGM